LVSFINFQDLCWDHSGEILSSLFTLFAGALTVVLPFATYFFIKYQRRVLDTPDFMDNFGTLTDGFKLSEGKLLSGPAWLSVFLAKRLLIALVLVYMRFHGLTGLQLMALSVISLGYQLAFAWCQPYQQRLSNYLELMNDFLMSLCIYCYLCLTEFTPPEVKEYAGLGVILCVALTIGVNMLVMVYLSIRDLWAYLVKRMSRAKRPNKTLAIRPWERFEMPRG
jgi:hypothetical protein